MPKADFACELGWGLTHSFATVNVDPGLLCQVFPCFDCCSNIFFFAAIVFLLKTIMYALGDLIPSDSDNVLQK